MKFFRYSIQEVISIAKFISFYYFELPKGYISVGEKHDFWEMVYVDKGEIIVNTDNQTHFLKQGDIVFYQPNEFHIGKSVQTKAPNLFVVSFECKSKAMDCFKEHPKFEAGNYERNLLEVIITEGVGAFGTESLTGRTRFEPKTFNSPFGGEQICRNYLETLLIHLVREAEFPMVKKKKLTSTGKESLETELTDQIVNYMEAHIFEKLSVDFVCNHFGISRSRLGDMFKKHFDCGVIEHLNQIKIQKAKTYIRNDMYNISEISNLLGYSSIHYFSRHFKKMTGMTPSEYSKTVKSRLNP